MFAFLCFLSRMFFSLLVNDRGFFLLADADLLSSRLVGWLVSRLSILDTKWLVASLVGTKWHSNRESDGVESSSCCRLSKSTHVASSLCEGLTGLWTRGHVSDANLPLLFCAYRATRRSCRSRCCGGDEKNAKGAS